MSWKKFSWPLPLSVHLHWIIPSWSESGLLFLCLVLIHHLIPVKDKPISLRTACFNLNTFCSTIFPDLSYIFKMNIILTHKNLSCNIAGVRIIYAFLKAFFPLWQWSKKGENKHQSNCSAPQPCWIKVVFSELVTDTPAKTPFSEVTFRSLLNIENIH